MAGRNRKRGTALLLALSMAAVPGAAPFPGMEQVRALEIEEMELIEEPEAGGAAELSGLQSSGGGRASGNGAIQIEYLDEGELTGNSNGSGAASGIPETVPGTAGAVPESGNGLLNAGAADGAKSLAVEPMSEPRPMVEEPMSEPESLAVEPMSEPGTVTAEPTGEPGTVTAEPTGESGTVTAEPTGEPGTVAAGPTGEPGTVTVEPMSEPGTMTAEPMSESETSDDPWESESETDTETEPDTDGGEGLSGQEKVYLGIDNRHIYEGMEQSFSDGYQPEIKDGSLYLVVPFTASGPLENNRLTVDLSFAEKENSPFVFKNYQKDIKRKQYVLTDGKMTEDTESSGNEGPDFGSAGQEADSGSQGGGSTGAGAGNDNQEAGSTGTNGDPNRCEAFVYTCQIPLQETASPGQYSLTVKAWGYTGQREKVTLDYQIFVRILPDPEPDGGKQDGGLLNEGGGSAGGGYSGGYSGGGEAGEEIIRQPKMLLESCSLAGRELEAGSREKLEASFQNRSNSQAMYNLKVVVSTESSSMQLARNSFYFPVVEPGGEISLEAELGIAMDAASGPVPLNFTFEYEDKKGTAATGTETVPLSVTQPVRMELETADIPAALYASDTVELSIKALNLSRTGVYNVRINLSGSGLFPSQDLFVGNMEAGTEGSGTMRIYVGTRTMESIGLDPGESDQEKYGPVSGTITMEYEDGNGETHQVTKDYQTEIKKAQILSLKVEEEGEEANSWWISVFSVVIAGLTLLVLLLFLRLRRKNILLEETRRK